MGFFFIALVFLLLYSYLIYPSSLLFFIKTKPYREELPPFARINLIIAAYNEDLFIENTIRKIFESDIDFSRVHIYIGNDGSDDETSDRLDKLKSEFSFITVEKFNRVGKGNVLNSIIEKHQLNQKGCANIFLDANIEVEKTALSEILHQLQNEKTGIAGASVYPMNMNSNVESNYILRENTIKANESRAFGIVVGVFGACFGMRGELYKPIPAHFITDDLYSSLSVIRQGYDIYYSENIKVYEDIHADVEDEFKRKMRFAAGNFQILWYFRDLLNPFRTKLGHIYAYFFHKIVRWLSPVALFGLFLYSLILNESVLFYVIRLLGILILLFLLINYQLYKYNKPIIASRLFYFFMMNLAILFGFINFLKGVKTNVWERSERI